MTRLGKILVFVNLVLTLMLAAFALGVFTNRIDWVGTPPNQSEGEIKKREAEIATLKEVYTRSVTRWQRESADLPAQIASRQKNQGWYAQQLKAVVEGKGANQPIDVLVFNNGALQVDGNTGLPVLRQAANPNWLPIRAQDEVLAAVDKDVASTAKEIQATITKEEELSKILNGVPGGLRSVLADTQEARRASELELQHVKKLRINGKEEAGSLLNRQRQLKARLELLKKNGIEAARLP
jgi:hypothetical protein